MPKYTESAIQHALEEVSAGLPLQRVAKRWGIPRGTLQKRWHGTRPRSIAFEAYQRLSQEQERALARWISAQNDLGCPPTHAQLRGLAQRVLHQANDHRPLGVNWVQGFLARNSDISSRRGTKLESSRFNGANTETIQGFFDLLEQPIVSAIRPENRYNMDETGLQEGLGYNGIVLGKKSRKRSLIKHPTSRTWTTILECISATGRYLRPLVIFKGKTVQHQWFPTELDRLQDWQFVAQPNGWTSDTIAIEWLKEVFIPGTKTTNNEKRLLIFDGHGSHQTDEFMYECFLNDIYLLFLPAHTSHVLQPLDISIFSPLKGQYRREINNINTYGISVESTPLAKAQFLQAYEKARTAAFTKRNIISGWRGTGLWPVNRMKALNNEMVASSGPPRPCTPESTVPEMPDAPTHIRFWTPKSGRDLNRQIQVLPVAARRDHLVRQLFAKMSKGLDAKNWDLAAQELDIGKLQAQITRQQPNKRQEVEKNPNERFVGIKEVIDTRRRMEVLLQPAATSQAAQNINWEDWCHEFQL